MAETAGCLANSHVVSVFSLTSRLSFYLEHQIIKHKDNISKLPFQWRLIMWPSSRETVSRLLWTLPRRPLKGNWINQSGSFVPLSPSFFPLPVHEKLKLHSPSWAISDLEKQSWGWGWKSQNNSGGWLPGHPEAAPPILACFLWNSCMWKSSKWFL